MPPTSRTVPATVTNNWPKIHDAIHRAGQSGELSELQTLLNTEDIHDKADGHDWRHGSVLHSAATTSVEIVDLLIANGAQTLLDSKCSAGEDGRWSGHSPLQVAAKSGCYDIASRLIDAGAAYDVFSAAALGDVEQLAKLLSDDNAQVLPTDDYNATLLHWAARQDQHDVTEFLLDQQLDIDAKDDFGDTPLLVASVREAVQTDVKHRAKRLSCSINIPAPSVVEILLDRGASVDVHSAAALGYADTLFRLVQNEMELARHANDHGTTPLHWAARNGHIRAAELLFDARADINAQDAIGCPPLWYAAYWGNNVDMTQFLCSIGADVTLKNVWGKDIRDYDIGYGCNAVVLRYQPSC